MKIIRIRKCYDCNHKKYMPEKCCWWCIKEGRPIGFIHGEIPYWCNLEDAPKAEGKKNRCPLCHGSGKMPPPPLDVEEYYKDAPQDKEIDAGVNFIMDTSFGGE